MGEIVIQMKGVTKTFHSEKKVVNDLTLDIHRGETISFLGPNGAGKTTTISMILGLISHDTGHISVLGKKPGTKEVRTKVGVMLQDISMIDNLKVREVIDLFRSYYPNPNPLDYLLKVSDLEADQNAMANKLSGGKIRRLQFALAMAGDPEILFLDEPTVGMDINAKKIFWAEIRKYLKKGKTIILTSHDLSELDSISDRVVIINKGSIIADSTVNELKNLYSTNRIQFKYNNQLNIAEIKKWDYIQNVQLNEEIILIETSNVNATLSNLLKQGIDISEIEVSRGSLEDVLLNLTQ